MNTANRAAARGLVSKNGVVSLRPAGEVGVSAKKKALAAEPAVASSSPTSKAPRQRSQPSRTASKIETLVCR